MNNRILKFAEWCNTFYFQVAHEEWQSKGTSTELFSTKQLYEKFNVVHPIADKRLEDAIHNYAKDNSINGVDYKIVKKNFSDGIAYNQNIITTDVIEKVVRYTVKNWASLNEQREKDHHQLLDNWLKHEFSEWLEMSVGITLPINK